ncbi:MAG: acyl-CoA dehydrogenase family protein [bacterium]
MQVKLSEDQIAIVGQARKFCENVMPMAYVRSMFEDPRGFTDAVWAKMAEMGWTGMLVPEAHGGLGLTLLDLAMVLEEMGRAVAPGPFFSTVLLASEAIAAAGSDEQKERYLPGLASGVLRGTLALHEPDGGADPDFVRMPASPLDGSFVLEGTKLFVPDAHVADILVCAARTSGDPSGGITLFLVETKTPGLTITLLPTMDGTRKLCAVDFSQVQVHGQGRLGPLHFGRAALDRVLARAQVGLCAECVGGAQMSMEIAVEYAKVRVQFDQPIGSFQSIKHRCAQMFVEAESARSLLYWAAWAQDQADAREAALAASVAKSYCSEVYRNASASAVQVLGGTGFSWEHDIHLHLKRAKANELALGDPAYHRERIVRLLEG